MPFYAALGNFRKFNTNNGQWEPVSDTGKDHITLAWRQDPFDATTEKALDAWPPIVDGSVKGDTRLFGPNHDIPLYEVAFTDADIHERAQLFHTQHLQADENGFLVHLLHPHITKKHLSNAVPCLHDGDRLCATTLFIQEVRKPCPLYERALFLPLSDE